MFPVAIVPICLLGAVLIALMRIKLYIIAECRLRLRLDAERIVIEKRWLERHARSRKDYERAWGAELRTLWQAHLPPLVRKLVRLRDFAWALDAELATLTNPEIASWTFIDRASHSRERFERLVARSLEQHGWQVAVLQGADRVDLQLIATRGRARVGIYCHHGAQPAECLAVHDAAIGRTRQRCEAVCVVTNGRFTRPVVVFAQEQDVALLHCSQLDQVAELARRDARAPASGSHPWRMAA